MDSAGKAALDELASSTTLVTWYVIEIAGYASSIGTAKLDQRLNEQRAEAVAQYLRENGNITMRRILVPAGYSATHPAVPNTDSDGRRRNRRVDVKLLVNNGLTESDLKVIAN